MATPLRRAFASDTREHDPATLAWMRAWTRSFGLLADPSLDRRNAVLSGKYVASSALSPDPVSDWPI